MATNHPTPLDYLKYCTAEAKSQLDYVIDQLSQVDTDYPLTNDHAEVLMQFLEGVQRTLSGSAAVFCRDSKDFDTYSDGRPVRTHLETTPGVIFEHRWHPQADHPDNQPHDIYTAKGRNGRRRTVLVAAPGVLDAVTAGPELTVVK